MEKREAMRFLVDSVHFPNNKCLWLIVRILGSMENVVLNF